MCDISILAALGLGGGTAAAGAATAAGATAGAATVGSVLSSVGTYLGAGATLAQGIVGYQTAKANVAAIESQKKSQAQITAVQDSRYRAQMSGEIARQRAELAARGVQLDSPSAVLLGQSAATEMSFGSQSIRSEGGAQIAALSAEQVAQRSKATSSLLSGTLGAASTVLAAAPDLWPGFSDRRFGRRMLA